IWGRIAAQHSRKADAIVAGPCLLSVYRDGVAVRGAIRELTKSAVPHEPVSNANQASTTRRGGGCLGSRFHAELRRGSNSHATRVLPLCSVTSASHVRWKVHRKVRTAKTAYQNVVSSRGTLTSSKRRWEAFHANLRRTNDRSSTAASSET